MADVRQVLPLLGTVEEVITAASWTEIELRANVQGCVFGFQPTIPPAGSSQAAQVSGLAVGTDVEWKFIMAPGDRLYIGYPVVAVGAPTVFMTITPLP